MTAAALEVRDLSKAFGGVQAVTGTPGRGIVGVADGRRGGSIASA